MPSLTLLNCRVDLTSRSLCSRTLSYVTKLDIHFQVCPVDKKELEADLFLLGIHGLNPTVNPARGQLTEINDNLFHKSH